MDARRLRNPGRLARELRSWSGDWFKSLGDDSPVAQLTARLEAVESQLQEVLRTVGTFEPQHSGARQAAEPSGTMQTGPTQTESPEAQPDAWERGLSQAFSPGPSKEQLRMPPLPAEFSGYTERSFSQVRAVPGSHGVAGPVIHGSLAGIGLGTLFNLFENERLAGLLTLRSERQQVDFLFREGGIVRCECDSTRIAAEEGVRIACTWASAEFHFRRDLLDEEMDAPRSANVLLLDALRQQDERAASR